MKRETQFKRCPGSLVFMQPKPEIFPCTTCGADTEIWSDESEGHCAACGATVVRYAGQSCVDWCKHARECLGDDKYKRYGLMRASMRKHALISAMEDYFGKNCEPVEHSKKIIDYAELILAEKSADESTADPNVVFAGAALLDTGRKDLRQESSTSALPDSQERRCLPAVQEILHNLGYSGDFVSEVCGIIEFQDRLRNDINFMIVHDADLLTNSEDQRIKDADTRLQDSFLQSFMTDSGRALAERGIIVVKRGSPLVTDGNPE